MKNIDLLELEKILVIIKDFPNTRVGYFCDRGLNTPKAVESYCKDKDIEYILNATTKEYYEAIKDSIKSRYFNLKRGRYLLNGKFYDYLFVDMNIEDSEKEDFLRKCHTAIKNGGLILIFVKKDDFKDIDNWNRLLEENYYVATNVVDIDSNSSLIISRKMHGWGG
jgi:hypothetical protein